MVINYTPIDVRKLSNDDNQLNTILLLIATLTALVLAILLFILIKKEISNQKEDISSGSSLIVSPTVEPSVMLLTSPSPLLISSPTPEATFSSFTCPDEEKICPDGSKVKRVGPKCEFAPCIIIDKIATASPTVMP